MKGMVGFFGMTLGSGIGWWLGAMHSITLAVVLSGIGGGVGLYLIRRLAEEYLE